MAGSGGSGRDGSGAGDGGACQRRSHGSRRVQRHQECRGPRRIVREVVRNCTKESGDTQSLVENALSYAERYNLEVGLKRRHSRAGVRPTRAGWFVRDFPAPMSGAEWYLYEALRKKHLSAALQVEPYRITESMPAPPSLRGSLKGSGLLYQNVARFQALAQLLVEVWLTPTARYSNRVAITEEAWSVSPDDLHGVERVPR